MSNQRNKLPLLCTVLLTGSFSCALVTPVEAPEVPIRLSAAATAQVPEPPPDPEATALVLRHLRSRPTGLSEAELEPLAHTVVREARRHDFDPLLVVAVMHIESRFNTYAVSPVQALGLMQVLPSTGREVAHQIGIPWRGPQTLFDPHANVRIGVAYLRFLTDRYGSVATALSAYNWGPGRIDRRLRRGMPLPMVYANSVLEVYGEPATRS